MFNYSEFAFTIISMFRPKSFSLWLPDTFIDNFALNEPWNLLNTQQQLSTTKREKISGFHASVPAWSGKIKTKSR